MITGILRKNKIYSKQGKGFKVGKGLFLFSVSINFKSQGSKISARSIRYAPVLKIFSTFPSSCLKAISVTFKIARNAPFHSAFLLDTRRLAGFESRRSLQLLCFKNFIN
jgi:hypothetical protein